MLNIALALCALDFITGVIGAYWMIRPVILTGAALCMAGIVLATVAGFL